MDIAVIVAIAIGLAVYGIAIKKSQKDQKDHARGWRVGHIGRDQMYYDEFIHGDWRRIILDGEMLMGRAHHAIFFETEAEWASYPSWAQGRRDEIIARIKSEFSEPDYVYHNA